MGILHPSPNTNRDHPMKPIDLDLITANHPIPIMVSLILMTLSKFQAATHILGHEQWLLLLLK